MSVYFQVAFASQIQVYRSVFGEKGEHVIKKRNPGFDGRFSRAIDIQLELNLCLRGDPLDLSLPFHRAELNKLLRENKAELVRDGLISDYRLGLEMTNDEIRMTKEFRMSK